MPQPVLVSCLSGLEEVHVMQVATTEDGGYALDSSGFWYRLGHVWKGHYMSEGFLISCWRYGKHRGDVGNVAKSKREAIHSLLASHDMFEVSDLDTIPRLF